MRKVLLSAVILAVLFLAACGSSNNGQNQNSGGNSPDSSQNSNSSGNNQVTLRYSWWGSDDRHKAILAAIEAYEAKNPHVRIEGEYGAFSSYYQKLLTQLAGNTAPDIISVDYKWVPDLMAMGKPFVDMNTMTDKIDMSGLDMKFAAEQAGDGDYLMGLPLGINAMGYLYNTEALAAANIDINNEWTWDTLLEVGTQYHQADNSKYLMFLNNEHYRYLVKTMLKQMTGNNMVNDDFSPGFTREELIQVFEYFVKLVDNGVIPPFEEAVQYGTVYADQIPGWHDGTYAIFPTSASKIPSIEIVSEFDVAVSRYPVQDNPVNPGIITSPSMLLTINQNSKHIDEAAKFIDWFMNSEEAALIVKDVNGMPAVKPVADLLAEQGFVNPLIAEMVNITMPYAGFPENGPSLNQEVLDLLSEYINLLGFKEMNPEQTADNFIKDLTAKLEELKAQ